MNVFNWKPDICPETRDDSIRQTAWMSKENHAIEQLQGERRESGLVWSGIRKGHQWMCISQRKEKSVKRISEKWYIEKCQASDIMDKLKWSTFIDVEGMNPSHLYICVLKILICIYIQTYRQRVHGPFKSTKKKCMVMFKCRHVGMCVGS